MHDLILTFTGGLGVALILGFISHRLGLSPIVGYLLAGIVVSPHTPGYVADRHLAEDRGVEAALVDSNRMFFAHLRLEPPQPHRHEHRRRNRASHW